MELSKRYIHAVTECLPESQRSDVAKELSASIEDMARDKSHGKEPTEKQIREVLEELGNPLEVARQYRGNKDYLIGPDFYYFYIQTLKRITALSVPIYSLIFAVTYHYTLPLNVGDLIVGYGFGLATVALHILFWITGLFVVIEKAGVSIKQFNESQGEWSVDSLPALPEEPQINRIDTACNMLFYAGVIVGAIVLWKLISQGYNGVAWLLNADLIAFWIPAVIGYGLLALIIETIKLAKPRLTMPLVVATLGVNLLGIAGVIMLASTHAILNPKLDGQAHDIALWSIGITVVIFVASYLVESYKTIKKYRTSRK